MEKLTRKKVKNFLQKYEQEELKLLLEDNGVESYANLPDFCKGVIYGLRLAEVAINNACCSELEGRD